MNKKNLLFIPVSPSRLISTLSMALILLTVMTFCIVYQFITPFPYYWIFYLCLAVYALIFFGAFAISYRGHFIAEIGSFDIKTVFMRKVCCFFKYDDIKYARFTKSTNYGFDLNAIYLVLSNEPIKGDNLAISFNPKTQIVIRITSKNQLKIKAVLTMLSLEIFNHSDFELFFKRIKRQSLSLVKQDNGKWFYE